MSDDLQLETVDDRLGRSLGDLRISVTDRCNFRCRYCMPREAFGEDFHFLPHAEILSFEEIERVASLFHRLGVRKFRLTGGEPLLRRDLTTLIAGLARLPDVDLAMTTNGSLLAESAESLFGAGLGRVSVSLDSLKDATFRRINDVEIPLQKVLEGIDVAARIGPGPVKINTVIQRGINDGEILELARYARDGGHILRLIEFMDVGTVNGWKIDDVVPAKEMLRVLESEFPVEPVAPRRASDVARRFRYLDGRGEVGLIASITRPFCGDCSRMRLSADGRLFTCLFAVQGFSLRSILRSGADDEEVMTAIRSVWQRRTDRYSEIRSSQTDGLRRIEMSYIGG